MGKAKREGLKIKENTFVAALFLAWPGMIFGRHFLTFFLCCTWVISSIAVDRYYDIKILNTRFESIPSRCWQRRIDFP